MSDFGELSRAATIALTPAGSVHWLAILLDAAVKGLVVLVVAAGATGLLRRTSAAVRHMVWTLSVIGLLCVPVLSIALPRLQVPLLPGWAGPAIQTHAPLPPPSPVQAPGVAKGPSASSIDESPAMLPSAHDVADNQDSPAPLPSGIGVQQPAPAVPAATAQPPAKTPTHWSTWILLGWAAGVLVLGVPLLIGTVMVWRMTRQAARVTDGSWPVLLKGLCRDLGLRRPVTLLRSAGSNIPLACGLLRPVIVLPAEADDWPADRRKVVLLHELAHVKRADCLTQLVARAARVLYWFNPLVHLACRMLRIERERACDDLVLAGGHKASDYASHLLEIVRTLRSMRCPSLAAVAMARPCGRLHGRKSQFEGRLLAILDPRRNRRALTRLGLLIAAILVAAFVVPLSIIKATAADKPAVSKEPATQPALPPGSALLVAGPGAKNPGVHAVDPRKETFGGALKLANVDLDMLKSHGRVAYVIYLWPDYRGGANAANSQEIGGMLRRDPTLANVEIERGPNQGRTIAILWLGTPQEWEDLNAACRKSVILSGTGVAIEENAQRLHAEGKEVKIVGPASPGYWPPAYDVLIAQGRQGQEALHPATQPATQPAAVETPPRR